MRRIAGEVDWLVRSFGVGGFGLRVAGLVFLAFVDTTFFPKFHYEKEDSPSH
jgi:hypothetical protein